MTTPSPYQEPARDRTAERDTEIIPVARKLLKKIADREDLMIGSSVNVNPEKLALYYMKVYQEDVIPLLLEHNVKLNAVKYLFTIMLQAINHTQDVTISSFEHNQDLADAAKYGVADIDDLRVADLDAALKAITPQEKSEQDAPGEK